MLFIRKRSLFAMLMDWNECWINITTVWTCLTLLRYEYEISKVLFFIYWNPRIIFLNQKQNNWNILLKKLWMYRFYIYHQYIPYSSSIIFIYFLKYQLLENHIKELQRVLKPGEKRLNWNSLGIHDYIVKCELVSTYSTKSCQN